MYKKASQLGLRIQTTKGLLSVEQLWNLSPTTIAEAIKDLNEFLKKETSDELSFLESGPEKKIDVENQLRFEILKDIYISKKEAAKIAKEQLENRERDQKILAILAKRQESKFENLSDEELNAMLSKK